MIRPDQTNKQTRRGGSRFVWSEDRIVAHHAQVHASIRVAGPPSWLIGLVGIAALSVIGRDLALFILGLFTSSAGIAFVAIGVLDRRRCCHGDRSDARRPERCDHCPGDRCEYGSLSRRGVVSTSTARHVAWWSECVPGGLGTHELRSTSVTGAVGMSGRCRRPAPRSHRGIVRRRLHAPQ